MKSVTAYQTCYMFPRFSIRRTSTFEKCSIFHPLQWFSTNSFTSSNATLLQCFQDLTTIDSLTGVPNFLFSTFYLSLLINFKSGPLLGLSCLMSSMFIIVLIIRIIKTTCYDHTILRTEVSLCPRLAQFWLLSKDFWYSSSERFGLLLH